MEELLKKIQACRVCAGFLPLGPRPVMTAGAKSRIVIVGQAPGRRVHQSGVAWDDVSGNLLRSWLGLTRAQFYNPDLVAVLPMGFCYPGTGKSGDLPPRPECAPLWHHQVLQRMVNPKLFLLVGRYAQHYYLKETVGINLTETVRNFRAYLPNYFPLPHPSPRNKNWFKQNPWFESELLPVLRGIIAEALG